MLAEHASVVAIGECGLDYNRDFSSRADQRRAFGDQLALAAELEMPLFLHERDAHDDFIAMLREVRDRIPRAVVHCFTGSREILRAYLDLDLHIGRRAGSSDCHSRVQRATWRRWSPFSSTT